MLVVFGGLVALVISIGVTDWNAEVSAVRVSIITVYVLVVTLALVWRNTIVTRAIAKTAREQIELQRVELRIAHKPFVVTDLSSERGYFIQNLGPGLAVNTYMVVPQDDGKWMVHELGGLGPGQHARVDAVHVGIANEGPARKHVIFAEGLFTRTAQWTATLNVVGDHRVAHRPPVGLTIPATPCTLADVLERSWQSLLKDLNDYKAELFKLAANPFDFVTTYKPEDKE